MRLLVLSSRHPNWSDDLIGWPAGGLKITSQLGPSPKGYIVSLGCPCGLWKKTNGIVYIIFLPFRLFFFSAGCHHYHGRSWVWWWFGFAIFARLEI